MKVILTHKETKILEHLRDGYAPKQIGNELKIPNNTVKFHLLIIRTKLGANSSYHAVILAIRQHLISLYQDD